MLALALSFAAYSEADAKRYTWASSYAYCSSMGNDNCGKAGAQIKSLGYQVLTFKSTGAVYNFINAAILKDAARKEIVVAFSGTKNPAQLAEEVLNNMPTSYPLHGISGAIVLHYFLDHYAAFSDWLESSLRSIGLSDYKIVFTGHSLGGALAVHAATDMLLEKIRSGSMMKVYTFGQPRVGNKEFDSVIKTQILDSYRVVHHKDLVVHVPPCIPKPIVGSTSCFSEGSIAFYPFNSLQEIFYDDAMSSYRICTASE